MPTLSAIKAVRIHAFGGPDVLQLEEVAPPDPQNDELLVRVYAAGVNPVDWKIREGLMGEIPFPSVMGSDFSGIVEGLGDEANGFQVGDPVFGVVSDQSGSYSEFAVAPVSQVALKPASLDHIQAAALPIAASTAWQALFDSAQLQPGQKVLIHAAAGGVGGFAVQLAKWKGAYVIGTASSHSAEVVRELGADEVINYQTTRFEEIVRDADVVFDTIGGETQNRSWRALKPGGILVSVVQPPNEQTAASAGVRSRFLLCQPKGRQLAQIAELVVSGRIKVRVDRILPLEQAIEAQKLSQSGHMHGKIVLRVSDRA